jgi:hypothetical protein
MWRVEAGCRRPSRRLSWLHHEVLAKEQQQESGAVLLDFSSPPALMMREHLQLEEAVQ